MHMRQDGQQCSATHRLAGAGQLRAGTLGTLVTTAVSDGIALESLLQTDKGGHGCCRVNCQVFPTGRRLCLGVGGRHRGAGSRISLQEASRVTHCSCPRNRPPQPCVQGISCTARSHRQDCEVCCKPCTHLCCAIATLRTSRSKNLSLRTSRAVGVPSSVLGCATGHRQLGSRCWGFAGASLAQALGITSPPVCEPIREPRHAATHTLDWLLQTMAATALLSLRPGPVAGLARPASRPGTGAVFIASWSAR